MIVALGGIAFALVCAWRLVGRAGVRDIEVAAATTLLVVVAQLALVALVVATMFDLSASTVGAAGVIVGVGDLAMAGRSRAPHWGVPSAQRRLAAFVAALMAAQVAAIVALWIWPDGGLASAILDAEGWVAAGRLPPLTLSDPAARDVGKVLVAATLSVGAEAGALLPVTAALAAIGTLVAAAQIDPGPRRTVAAAVVAACGGLAFGFGGWPATLALAVLVAVALVAAWQLRGRVRRPWQATRVRPRRAAREGPALAWQAPRRAADPSPIRAATSIAVSLAAAAALLAPWTALEVLLGTAILSLHANRRGRAPLPDR